MLKDTFVEARFAAARALEAFGPKAKPAAPALAEALKDKDVSLRVSAARALYAATGEADRVVPVLVAALGGADEWLQLRAIDALDKMGTAAEEALPALTKALDDPFCLASPRAALLLYKLRGAEAKAAVPALLETIDSGGEYYREAMAALKKIDLAAYAKARRARR